MIDRKRLVPIAVGVFVVLVIVVLAVSLVIASQSRHSGAAPSPSASSSTGSAQPQIAFTEEQLQIVRDTAVASIRWGSSETPEQLRTRYEQAGMSAELARTYTPIWAELLVGANAGVSCMGAEVKVIDYSPGDDPGTGKFLVSVKGSYDGESHKDGQLLPVGPGTATWTYTFDERTSTITHIEHPPLSDLHVPLR